MTKLIRMAGVLCMLVATLYAAGSQTATPKQLAHVAKKTKTEFDNFSGEYSVTTEGPDVQGDGFFYSIYLLSSFTKKKPAPEYSIIVKYSGQQWLLLDTAKDGETNTLKTEVLGRGPAQGFCCENVSTTVERSYLEAHAQSGLVYRLYGKGGNITIEVPNYWIVGFLKKHDEFFAKQGFAPTK